MCGIAGYYGAALGAPANAVLLRAMSGSLAHRGPDASGLHVADGAGLAHTRLAIVGLADGAQPMAILDGRYRITFNGEIFNFVELRARLEAGGRRFRTGSDTEVILHAYDAWGEACVAAFNGDFAFAIWEPGRRRMFLARDRMGVRPLFHAERAGTLYFASEVKALLRVPGIEAEPDPFALDQVFTLWAPTPPRTAFRGISELPPAHTMTLTPEGVRVRRYWALAFPDAGEAGAEAGDGRSEARVAGEVLALLDDATRLRLRADVPVGAYLSGGFDSALVCALAARRAPGLRTFSVTFDSPEHDESREQAAMVAHLATDHAAVACRGGDIARDFPAVVRHAERPLVRTGPAPLYRLSALVRARGLKVVLTGEGADEVFAGYDLFKEDAVRRFCARQPGSRLRPHLLRRLYPYLPGLRRQGTETLAAFFGPGAGMDDPLHAHRPRMRATAAAKRVFSPALRAELGGYDAAAELAERLPADFRRWHPLHQAQYVETTCLLPDYILSSQGDRMAMAHGVEGRFPFLDHRVVEHAARIPPRMKLRTLREKRVLRQAAEGLLPRAIAGRPKQPYRAPDSPAFAGPSAPPYVARLLAPEAVAATGLFDPAAVAALAAKCRASGAAGFRDNTAFVGVLSTQLWHEAFGPGRRTRGTPAPTLEDVP